VKTPEGESSGQKPEEKKKMRPTIIGQPVNAGAPKATVLRPTVIGGEAPASPPSLPKLKPTAIHIPPPAPQQTAKAKAPTVFGVQRKRIPATIDDLRKQNSHTDQKVLETALQLILATNVEEMDDDQCILWGKTQQEKYTACVNENLKLSQTGAAADVIRQLTRLQEVLGQIDFERLFGLEKGFFSKLTRESSEKRLAFFGRIQTEMNQIINLLAPKEQELLDHQNKVQALIRRIHSADGDMEAYAIAADFLANYLRQEYANDSEKKRLANLLEQRSMLLTRSIGQIRANAPLLKQQEEQPLNLINCIQSTVLVEVPNWLNTYASLRGVLEGKQTPTMTQIDELSRGRNAIIGNLKGN
jgi:uncharacterized protein YaaN involved in tellurite resistance